MCLVSVDLPVLRLAKHHALCDDGLRCWIFRLSIRFLRFTYCCTRPGIYSRGPCLVKCTVPRLVIQGGDIDFKRVGSGAGLWSRGMPWRKQRAPVSSYSFHSASSTQENGLSTPWASAVMPPCIGWNLQSLFQCWWLGICCVGWVTFLIWASECVQPRGHSHTCARLSLWLPFCTFRSEPLGHVMPSCLNVYASVELTMPPPPLRKCLDCKCAQHAV